MTTGKKPPGTQSGKKLESIPEKPRKRWDSRGSKKSLTKNDVKVVLEPEPPKFNREMLNAFIAEKYSAREQLKLNARDSQNSVAVQL